VGSQAAEHDQTHYKYAHVDRLIALSIGDLHIDRSLFKLRSDARIINIKGLQGLLA
jgi:hypothetical protein